MICTSRRTSSISSRLMSFRLAIDLQAKCCLVSLWVTKYVTPNWPRPTSRPNVYVFLTSSIGRPRTLPTAAEEWWRNWDRGGGEAFGGRTLMPPLEGGGLRWLVVVVVEEEEARLLQFPILGRGILVKW